MAFTSSQLQRSYDRPQQTQLAGQDLFRIRTLYLERRYKQCISLCTDLVDPDVSMASVAMLDEPDALQLHPVYEAFQLFHQAICYEALGLAAHNYSRNKISFLDSAKEQFAAALDALPQPFVTEEAGRVDTLKSSPLDDTFMATETLDTVQEDSLQEAPVPSNQVASRTRTPSEASSHYSSSASSSVSDTCTVPDFGRYSPRPDLLTTPSSIPRTVTFPNVQKQDLVLIKDEEADSEEDAESTPPKLSYQNRLSACLSSQHVLSDDLVPSPLFSRNKKAAQITYPPAANEDTITNDERARGIAQPPRPLPRTLHTHQNHHPLLPARRTAVQTLISKYEQTLPSPNTPSSYTTATPSASAFTPNPVAIATPATARFANIASIFAPRLPPHHIDTSNPGFTFSDYLSSHTLARYNNCLSSFRNSLLVSVTRIKYLIDEAHEIQERHVREKQEAALRDLPHSGGMGQARLRSMWLLQTPTSVSPPAPRLSRVSKADSNHAGPQPLVLTAKSRAADLVSPSPSPTDAPPNTSASTPNSDTEQSAKPKTRFIDKLSHLRAPEDSCKELERIEKLRASGFAVHKEKYGWKGSRYYEDLRRSVETELGG